MVHYYLLNVMDEKVLNFKYLERRQSPLSLEAKRELVRKAPWQGDKLLFSSPKAPTSLEARWLQGDSWLDKPSEDMFKALEEHGFGNEFVFVLQF